LKSQKVTLDNPLIQPSWPTLIGRRLELGFRKVTSPFRALPDFVIVGAQKCGTSSLHQYFIQHPRLLAASIKEVHFFDGGLHPKWDKFAEGEALYRSYFPLRSSVRRKKALCFEASPNYMFSPVAPKRMARMVPEAKIVVLLRDPVERAISHYFHELRRGRETDDIETAFSRESERLSEAIDQKNYKDTKFINLSYKTRGRYAEQLTRLFRHFPSSNVQVIEAETFFEDPIAVMSQILDFVGLEQFDIPVDVRPTGEGSNKIAVPDDVRKSLHAYFAEPNRALVKLLGREFRWT
jgi:hypothetical protein